MRAIQKRASLSYPTRIWGCEREREFVCACVPRSRSARRCRTPPGSGGVWVRVQQGARAATRRRPCDKTPPRRAGAHHRVRLLQRRAGLGRVHAAPVVLLPIERLEVAAGVGVVERGGVVGWGARRARAGFRGLRLGGAAHTRPACARCLCTPCWLLPPLHPLPPPAPTRAPVNVEAGHDGAVLSDVALRRPHLADGLKVKGALGCDLARVRALGRAQLALCALTADVGL